MTRTKDDVTRRRTEETRGVPFGVIAVGDMIASLDKGPGIVAAVYPEVSPDFDGTIGPDRLLVLWKVQGRYSLLEHRRVTDPYHGPVADAVAA